MSKPQYAKIKQPDGIDPPNPHCPMCGKPAIPDDEKKRGEEKAPCQHLTFAYIGMVDQFEYRTDEFWEKFESLGVNKEENFDEYPYGLTFENFPEILEKMGYDNKLLVLEISYGGMSCGPYGGTVAFGFDYSKLENNEE